MNKKTKKRLLHIGTPFVLALICGGVTAGALIKPYDKIKMFMNLAFMDELKTNPDNRDSGLVIKENEIISDYEGETYDSGEFIRPSFGELYAVIDCKAFDTSVPVYWGCNSELLELGSCQSTGSVIAGDKGNTVISAHVDTYFASLNKLKKDDKVTIRTNYGEFVYTVKQQVIFNKKEGKYVSPTEDDRLTLYTCKRDLLGNMDDRIGVICTLTEKKYYNNAEGGEQ